MEQWWGERTRGLLSPRVHSPADARREATRDGAPVIDLLDGEAICQLLNDLKFGLKVRPVEEVEVDQGFFASI